MIPGETLRSSFCDPSCGHLGKCDDCGVRLELQVLSSPAGWYLGTFCNCGPYSRETHYMERDEAIAMHKDVTEFGDWKNPNLFQLYPWRT